MVSEKICRQLKKSGKFQQLQLLPCILEK